jgi:hypothetical protein
MFLEVELKAKEFLMTYVPEPKTLSIIGNSRKISSYGVGCGE